MDSAAQFNNLSIVLHLATAENIATAVLYDSLLSAHIEELARDRAERATAAVNFAELLPVEQHRFKLQAVSQAAKSATPVDLKKEKRKSIRIHLQPRNLDGFPKTST